MTNSQAKNILQRVLDSAKGKPLAPGEEKIARGELMDAIHVASIEAMKQFSDPTMDKELVKMFEELAEQVSKS